MTLNSTQRILQEFESSRGGSFRARRQQFNELMVNFLIPVLLVLHAVLGILMEQNQGLATAHAYVTLGIAALLAISDAPLYMVACAAAYIAGTEVLWRMTKASLIWEMGKYAVIGIMAFSMFRARHFRIPVVPLLYILLLLPSALITFDEMGFSDARSEVSFNLSGHLALMVCAWFFSYMELDLRKLKYILLSMLAPVVSIGAIALWSIATAPELTWYIESNFTASGGYGPNQVSSMLGLGVLAAWIMLLIVPMKWPLRLTLAGVTLWLLGQTFLTFSRGGLLTTIVAALLFTGHVLIDQRHNPRLMFTVVITILVAVVVMLPQLDAFTGGALEARYTDAETSERDVVIRVDLEVFADNFWFGVGPGEASAYRAEAIGFWVAAHTEYTRMLAEHGVMGLLAIILLFVMAAHTYFKEKRHTARGLVMAFVVWSMIFMVHAAMRVVAPALLIGLAYTNYTPALKDSGVETMRRLNRRGLPAPAASDQAMLQHLLQERTRR